MNQRKTDPTYSATNRLSRTGLPLGRLIVCISQVKRGKSLSLLTTLRDCAKQTKVTTPYSASFGEVKRMT